MNLERIGHELFSEFGNSQLCFCNIRKMEQTMRDEWVRGLLKNHHKVICASEPGKAAGFETMLLEDDE